jgi:murein DD-endopeptidase MepM/ murein hydrolase activator NlpD
MSGNMSIAPGLTLWRESPSSESGGHRPADRCRRRLARSAAAATALVAAVAGCGVDPGVDRGPQAAYLSLPSRYTELINAAGSLCPAITPEVIAAQIALGSRSTGRAGASFEAQTWAAVGADFDGDGRASASDPADNIPALGRYMCELHRRVERLRAEGALSGGELRLTLAAYRDGLPSVVRAGRVTQSASAYVGAVETAVEEQRGGTVVAPLPGYRDSDNFGVAGAIWCSGYHTGDVFPAPCGTPVDAATAGIVRVRADEPWAGIALVEVVAGDGVVTWYAHMQQVVVADGGSVLSGQPIGAVGDLGNAYGCHLHFEVHPGDGEAVDPHDWLLENGVGL